MRVGAREAARAPLNIASPPVEPTLPTAGDLEDSLITVFLCSVI